MSTGKNDCIVIHFDTFKEKIKIQKELDREMIKAHGRNRYKLSILDNCVMAEFQSANKFF